MPRRGPDVTCRRARRDDARDLARLHAIEDWCYDDENIIHEYWDDAFDKESILVAEQKGKVVGTLELAVAQKSRWGGRFGLVRRFVVHPKWRSAGVGRRLFGFAMREAKRLKLVAVELNVEGWNSRPYQFYRSQGFVEDRVEVVMVKWLKSPPRKRKAKPAPVAPKAEPGKPLKSCRVCEFELPHDENPCRYCGSKQ